MIKKFCYRFKKIASCYTIPVFLIVCTFYSFLGLVDLSFRNLEILCVFILVIILLLTTIFTNEDFFEEEVNHRILVHKNSLKRFNLFIRTTPIFLTLCFAVAGNRISDSTRVLFSQSDFLELDIDIDVLLFWALLSAWAILLPMYLTKNDKLTANRLEELTNSIQSSPNKRLLAEYPELYNTMISSLKGLDKMDFSSEIEEISDKIKVILLAITKIVKNFSPFPNKSEIIGANLWILFNKLDKSKVISSLPQTISFNCTFQEDSVIGVAILMDSLIFRREFNKANFNLDKRWMILPIPKSQMIDGIQYALPGVPKAAKEGLSVYDNISTLYSQLDDFKASTRQAITEYFSKDGEGGRIKSFASYRIGTESDPLAVLNIDSNYPLILGDEMYYQTFIALVEPILESLCPLVREYTKLYVEKSEFPW